MAGDALGCAALWAAFIRIMIVDATSVGRSPTLRRERDTARAWLTEGRFRKDRSMVAAFVGLELDVLEAYGARMEASGWPPTAVVLRAAGRKPDVMGIAAE